MNRFCAGMVVTIGLAIACSACRAATENGAGRVVYLSFADGTEGVRLGEDDDASGNVSRLCAIDAFARWSAMPGCGPRGDRDACRETIRSNVASYFAAYDVSFTTTRPTEGAYTMVVIAPPNEACTFGRRGVSFADCENANPSSVAFVFDCEDDVESCAVLIAHETAHTFGLVHVLDQGDVMTPAPEGLGLDFRDKEAAALENECGAVTQSSDGVLSRVLGRR